MDCAPCQPVAYPLMLLRERRRIAARVVRWEAGSSSLAPAMVVLAVDTLAPSPPATARGVDATLRQEQLGYRQADIRQDTADLARGSAPIPPAARCLVALRETLPAADKVGHFQA